MSSRRGPGTTESGIATLDTCFTAYTRLWPTTACVPLNHQCTFSFTFACPWTWMNMSVNASGQGRALYRYEWQLKYALWSDKCSQTIVYPILVGVWSPNRRDPIVRTIERNIRHDLSRHKKALYELLNGDVCFIRVMILKDDVHLC